MSRAETGRLGENAAAEYLEKRGYRIVERNYSRRCGEIDIIAYKDKIICFVEVRTRAAGSMLSGAQTVDIRKMQRVYKTACLWLMEHEADYQPRFDVAEIVSSKDGSRAERINYIENAFGAEVCGEIF